MATCCPILGICRDDASGRSHLLTLAPEGDRGDAQHVCGTLHAEAHAEHLADVGYLVVLERWKLKANGIKQKYLKMKP